jgi:hypothetical protein
VSALFKQLEGTGADFNLRVSFLELYNEELQVTPHATLDPTLTGDSTHVWICILFYTLMFDYRT